MDNFTFVRFSIRFQRTPAEKVGNSNHRLRAVKFRLWLSVGGGGIARSLTTEYIQIALHISVPHLARANRINTKEAGNITKPILNKCLRSVRVSFIEKARKKLWRGMGGLEWWSCLTFCACFLWVHSKFFNISNCSLLIRVASNTESAHPSSQWLELAPRLYVARMSCK
jgi:hypothetical protein